MESILNYQMSFFGLYSFIKPTTEIILKLMQEFKEEKFIPGTINMSTIEGNTGKVTNESRIRMISEDEVWEIVFLNERIDINYKSTDRNTNKINSIDDLTKKAKLYGRRVFKLLNIKSSRLAINLQGLTYQIKEEYIDKIIESFNIIPDFYKNNGIKGFSTTINKESKIQINECDELINVVTSITCVDTVGNNQGKKFLLGFDINTRAEKLNERFDENSIGQFSNKVLSTLIDISNDFEVIFKDGELLTR